jgi:hypothetical protein
LRIGLRSAGGHSRVVFWGEAAGFVIAGNKSVPGVFYGFPQIRLAGVADPGQWPNPRCTKGSA